MTDVLIDARRGAGSSLEILYGTVTWKPTLTHSRGTSIVLPAPTTYDLVDGQVVATNVQPTPEPVEGQIEWAYEVTFKDRRSKSYSFLVGVPDSTTQVNFIDLPRYFETKPPLFGQGPQGVPGEAATVAVGTVTGGTTPNVTNSGTNTDAVLNFVLPKGDKGDTGAGVPAGGTALEYLRKDSAGTGSEWVSASGALASASSAGFMSAADKALLGTATFEPEPNALIKRSGSGRVNYPDPASIQNPVTVNWLNNNIDNRVEGVLTASPDSLTKIQLDKMYLKKNERIFNVMDYGAARDGVTSDVTPINLAIQAANAAGGGTVFMPSGEYYMQNYATLLSNVTVEGTGNTVINVDGGGSTAKFAILSNGATGYGSGGSGMALKKLTFRGSFANSRGIGALGAHHGSNILIEDCTFIEAHRYGHIFDLQGCNNVVIRRCKFYGADYSASTGDLTGEAIQLDYSTRTGASVVDAVGSYDGLPTKDVIVEECEFLPVYVGATLYPCPNPIGSHFTVEGYYVENIVFRNNIVDRPWDDTTNTLRGTLHFVAAKNVQITNNVFKGTTNRSQRVIATIGLTTAFPVATVNDSPQSSVPLAVPSVCESFEISGNTFTGFGAVNSSNDLMYLSGQNSSGYVNDIRVHDNRFIGCYPPGASDNSGMHLIYPRFASNVIVRDNYIDRCRRLVFFGTVKNLSVLSNTVEFGGSAGDVNGSGAVGLTVRDNDFLSTGLGVYASTSSQVNISGNRITTRVDATSVIDMNGVQRYVIEGNIINCPTTVARGIVARGDSDPGIIKNNIVSGATEALVMDASSTPINSDNILV